jgi:hypothetical protein
MTLTRLWQANESIDIKEDDKTGKTLTPKSVIASENNL